MTIFEAVTFSIAVLGAVLGLANTWRNLEKDRVKIKVVPAHPMGKVPTAVASIPHEYLSIEITNLSSFPVTISEAGVLFKGTNDRRIIYIPERLWDEEAECEWPKRLEPRSSITLYCWLFESSEVPKIKCAYAKTQCGVIAKGKSKALKEIVTNQRKP